MKKRIQLSILLIIKKVSVISIQNFTTLVEVNTHRYARHKIEKCRRTISNLARNLGRGTCATATNKKDDTSFVASNIEYLIARHVDTVLLFVRAAARCQRPLMTRVY